MLKRIINCFVKYRIWFFFVACLCFLATVLYLHGSVYRYVNLINGHKILPKDTRSIGVFHIYIWIAICSLFFSFFTGILYVFSKNQIGKNERIIFLIVIVFFIVLVSISLFVLGVFYV